MPPEININISAFTKETEVGRKEAKKEQGERIRKERREKHKHYYSSRNQNNLVSIYHKQ